MDNAVQGTANLSDESVVLDIPCGKLLDSPGVVINGEKEPAEHLYGFSQDGYALVLRNVAYGRVPDVGKFVPDQQDRTLVRATTIFL